MSGEEQRRWGKSGRGGGDVEQQQRRKGPSASSTRTKSEAGPSWEDLQDVMDDAFHGADGPFPRGSAEHQEAATFVPKLARMLAAKQKQQQQQGEGEGGGASRGSNPEPNPLGLPASYDPRYRINVSIAADPLQVMKALSAAKRGRDWRRHEETCAPLSLTEAAERYRSMLGHYEDFRQKKLRSRLQKLRADKAALPIAPFEEAFIGALKTNQVVVLAGDTGCGKSTQLPQFLLRAGYNKVAVTQPRRISAMALCRRVAYETLNEHGDEVAYQIRFDSSRGAGTRLTFMTEGILLRRLAGDPQILDFDCVVLDEVHERHLSTDFLLALLRAIVTQRPSLRVVLMSATINVKAYSAYFNTVPIISVPGRLYPIKVVYLPPSGTEVGSRGRRTREEAEALSAKGGKRTIERISPAPYLRVLQIIDKQVAQDERGDVLVFLSGMDDISVVADALGEYAAKTQRWVILKLHSSMAVEDQDRVFDVAEPGVRKCILSTNIAETSVTIDGIRFVVDSGRSKEMLHDSGSGTCYRLYSEGDFERFPPFNLPEIQRVRLETVILQIKQLAGAAMDPRHFGFIDPPKLESLEAAITSLKNAQALDENELLTPLGAILASLPVDIQIGKMLIYGCVLGCSAVTLTLAAALSVQSPFLRVANDGSASGVASARREFESADGDPFTLLLLFEQWIQLKNDIKTGRHRTSSRKWCQARGVEEQRLYEMAKLKRQFEDLLSSTGLATRQQQDRRGATGGSRRGRPNERPQGKPGRSWLREQQRRQEKHARTRRVLKAEGEGSGEDNSGSNDERPGCSSKGKKRRRQDENGRAMGEHLKQLDLELTVDVSAMASAAAAGFTQGDVSLLKFVVTAGLYPNLAVAAIGNMHRRDADVRFHTASHGDAALHPGSCMAQHARELSDGLLVAYVEALETRSLFLCNNIPVSALAAALLNAAQIDTDLAGSRIIVDRWLLLRVHGPEGPDLLVSAARMRGQLGALLAHRLREAWDRQRTGAEWGFEPHVSQPGGRPLSAAVGLPAWASLALTEWEAAQAMELVDRESLVSQLANAGLWHVHFTVERLTGSTASAHFVDPTPAAKPGAGEDPHQAAGWQLTPWLKVGSLRSTQSDLAAHATLPTLRRHWRCPGCQAKVIGTSTEIEAHVDSCEAARELPPETLELGYARATAGVPGQGEVRFSRVQQGAEKGERERAKGQGADLSPAVDGEVGDAQKMAAAAREYYCPECSTHLVLTATQILQHKKMHRQEQTK